MVSIINNKINCTICFLFAYKLIIELLMFLLSILSIWKKQKQEY